MAENLPPVMSCSEIGSVAIISVLISNAVKKDSIFFIILLDDKLLISIWIVLSAKVLIFYEISWKMIDYLIIKLLFL